MRAAVTTRYGPPEVVQVRDVATPVPKPNEILVRVHATTVCAADWRLRRANPFLVRFAAGLTRPSRMPILGLEFSGRVKAVGSSVTKFSPGDAIIGSTVKSAGAHAEYVCIAQDGLLAPMPNNMTFEEAAALQFGAVSALHFLRKAKIQPGQRVLVYGASGSVGVFAVQLAKYFGAHVTGVCGTTNIDLVRSLGADEVIDYTRSDFTAAGKKYDVIFEAVGKSGGLSRCLKALKRGGTYLWIAPNGHTFRDAAIAISSALSGRAKTIFGVASGTVADLMFFKQLIEAGTLRTVIDKRYSLDEIAEAHRHAESGHKRGHVVVVPLQS